MSKKTILITQEYDYANMRGFAEFNDGVLENWQPDFILAPTMIKKDDGSYELIGLSIIRGQRWKSPLEKK